MISQGGFEDSLAAVAHFSRVASPRGIDPYYRRDLALIHHLAFGFHADACTPGVLSLLTPVRDKGGFVVELGCGSGLLTRHLVDAGHHVLATDASPAMLQLAREYARGAEEFRQLILPDDPIPPCDAIVSVGHVLSYLPNEASVERALTTVAEALRPGGILALDLCDLGWGRARQQASARVWRGDDWVLIAEFTLPSPNRYVRDMTTFIRNPDGSWRRDDERHENVLIDTRQVPPLLAKHHVNVALAASFGDEKLPEGLVAVVGQRQTTARSPGR